MTKTGSGEEPVLIGFLEKLYSMLSQARAKRRMRLRM
jgi:hypothetical protein